MQWSESAQVTVTWQLHKTVSRDVRCFGISNHKGRIIASFPSTPRVFFDLALSAMPVPCLPHYGDLDLPQGSIKWNLWDALKTDQEEEVQVGWFRKPKPHGDSQRLEERLSDAVNLSFFLFPERLGEGRFLGAVSLSSLTWLAWFKLLNLNLLDLTCLTWTCLTKTFLTWLSWLDLGKLLTWSA